MAGYLELALYVLSFGIVGMPHGAMDGWILAKDSKRSNIIAFGIYSLIAAASFLVWLILPSIFWIAFGLVTIWHFGFETLEENVKINAHKTNESLVSFEFTERLLYLAKGLLIVFSLGALHDVNLAFQSSANSIGINTSIYQALSFGAFSKLVIPAILFTIIIRLSAKQKLFTKGLIELVWVGLLFTIAKPMIAFAAYFLIHSIRHMYSLKKELNAPIIPMIFWGILLSLPAFFAIAVIVDLRVSLTNVEAIGQISLVIVATLTFPHAVLTSTWLHKKKPLLAFKNALRCLEQRS